MIHTEVGTESPPYLPGASLHPISFRPASYRQARAQRRPPTAPKPAESEPLFGPLNVTERQLPNGLKLMLLENHDLPAVTLAAQVRAGSSDDTDARAGLANFAARMLEEGTRSYSHAQISEALEFVGASFASGAGRNVTTVSLNSLSRYTRSLLPIYAEMLTAPAFPAERAELERTRILADLEAADEDPSDVARRLFYAKIFGSHPHHRPVMGYAATVKQLGPAQMRQFHQQFYVPGNTTIAVVGDFKTEEMLPDLTRAFSGWTGRQPPTRPTVDPPPATAVTGERKRMEKAQTQIVLGHLGIHRLDKDYIPLLVMDSILGEGVSGGFTARIPFQLRDVQGLAYSVGSSITSSASFDPGAFIAQMSTEPKNEARAVSALLAEIRRIRSEPVSDKELREAVNYLVNSYVFGFETHGQLASYLLSTSYYGLGVDYRQQFPRLVRQVTRADVQRVAVEHLRPDRYTLIVVGPETKP